MQWQYTAATLARATLTVGKKFPVLFAMLLSLSAGLSIVPLFSAFLPRYGHIMPLFLFVWMVRSPEVSIAIAVSGRDANRPPPERYGNRVVF